MVVKELRLQLTVASLRLTVSVSCYLSLTITKIRDSRGTLDIFMEDEEEITRGEKNQEWKRWQKEGGRWRVHCL